MIFLENVVMLLTYPIVGIRPTMVCEAIHYKTILNSYANQHAKISPIEQEWSKVEYVCKFLETFE
jgi:hypothetical protein